jgi:hypothetical protein
MLLSLLLSRAQPRYALTAHRLHISHLLLGLISLALDASFTCYPLGSHFTQYDFSAHQSLIIPARHITRLTTEILTPDMSRTSRDFFTWSFF